MAAAAAGKHLLCEKPFARDADEAREMLVAAERASVTHLLGTEFRFATAQASLQRTIAGGAIGQPRSALFVHFRLTNGCTGLMHSSCAIGGQFVATTKITATAGSAWLQGDEVWIDRGEGPQRVPDPTDLPIVAPDPPPAQLLHTTYDMWHSMGLDLAPYARLCARLRSGALGEPVADDPPAATFADGVAGQLELDAIRRSSSAGGWVAVDGM